MNVKFQYQGMNTSPWMSEYLEGKITHLERYLSPASEIIVELIHETDRALTRFHVYTLKQEYTIDREGEDIFESFTGALDEISKILRRDHQKLIEKAHKKFTVA